MSSSELIQDCETIHPLIPAYGLGAADADEVALVEAHVAQCPQAAAELADYVALAETMLFSAPRVQAPAGLAAKLRAAAAPAAAQTARQSVPTQAQPGFWQRLSDALSPRQWRPAYVLAALALVALVATNLYWGSQVRAVHSAQQALAARLDRQTEVLTQVGEGNFLRIYVPAGPAGEASDAYATVVCNPKQEAGFILAENLPALPADQAYQVWLTKDGQRTSGGLLQTNDQGLGWLVFRAPLPMGQYTAVDITAEPAASSAAPTTQPVIQGNLYDGDYHAS